MTKRPVRKPIDRNAIIADLQAKLRDRDEELASLKDHHEYVKAQSDKNYESGAAWKKAADEARKEAAAYRDRIAASDEIRMQAEGKLRFAEGYIAALTHSSYFPVEQKDAAPEYMTDKRRL